MKAFIELLKKYWKFAVFVATNIIVLFLLSRKNNLEISERLKELNDSNKKKIDDLNAVREKEKKQLEENEIQLKKQLEATQQHYETAVKNEKQRDDALVNTTAKQFENKPDDLASEISKKLNVDLYVGDKK